jgi:hypothetical protein
MLIPEATAQGYDNYAWYGLDGVGTTNTDPGHTLMNNQTYAEIEHSGYVVIFQTNFSGGCNGEVKFKLGRPTGTSKEFNVFWTDPAGMRVQQAGATNYTGFNEAVQVDDVVGAYFDTGVGNSFFCQYVEASMPAYYKHNADVSGTQVFTDTVAGRGLAIRVLVGWDNPPGPDWGAYLYHGFGIVGISMMALAPLVLVRSRGSLDDKVETMAYALVTGVIGFGLFLSWIYYA